MQVSFKNSFIKDFKRLPDNIKKEVKEICLSIFPKIKNLSELKSYKTYPLKKMRGLNFITE